MIKIYFRIYFMRGLVMFQRMIVGIVCLNIFISSIHGFHIDNDDVKQKQNKNSGIINTSASSFFKPISLSKSSLGREKILTDPMSLLHAAKDTLRYINLHEQDRHQTIAPDHFNEIMSLDQVKKTLRYVVDSIEEDKKMGKEPGKFRILDPKFIAKHFNFIAWTADAQTAKKHNVIVPKDGELRLTNYAVFVVTGSKTKTKQHNCALYEIRDHSLPKKISKQTVLAGILEQPRYQKKVRPLAWVSRDGLEEGLMQGTVLVKFPDSSYKIFNVHLNNGIAYEKNKPVLQQKRYWFFKELKHSAKSVETFKNKIKRRSGVIFAGDIHNIGTGKLIALRYTNPITKQPGIRLGVLADTGSAFVNNLYQLDFFAGLFSSRQLLSQHMKQLPIFTHAYLLSKK